MTEGCFVGNPLEDVKIKNLECYCIDCCKETKHKTVCEHLDSFRDDYSYDIFYQIIECLGCGRKSFRQASYDLEQAYPTYGGNWEIPEDIQTYPRALVGHKKIEDIWSLPSIVRDIYSEVLVAMQEGSNILAGFGLRATVEALCNDLNIKGRTLEVRINRLSQSGFISKIDAERLHGIRFMGNDAAHNIIKPKDLSLSVALQIIEHLISSVYILDDKAKGNLDTIVSTFDSFIEILNEKLCLFSSGDEYPIAKYLGKGMRRIKDARTTLEKELILKINNGEYNKLSLGKIDSYEGSSEQLQHFVLK